jgi:hypothetical protein
MLNYGETPSNRSNIPPSGEQKTRPLTSLLNLNEYVPLRIGKKTIAMVSPPLRDGYLAARKAYAEMEEQTEDGPYLLLSGYEFAHLTRQYIPAGLSPADKREWQRGFIAGWNAATFWL